MTNPTPPNPPEVSAEMPKPDARMNMPASHVCRAWKVENNTTSIERYAQQQRERAEKAERALLEVGKEVVQAAFEMTVLEDERDDLQAENARLREELERIATGNNECLSRGDFEELAHQALHGSPAAGGKDEDE
jgi:hypothetical protein